MTLTQTAIWTKRGILALIFSLIIGIAGAIGYNIWRQYYLAHLPPVEEKPEAKFGNLPQLTFPPETVSSSNFSYSLDTVTGGLPQTQKIIKVYFIPKTAVSLMAPERSKKLAETLGFNNGPETLTPTEYKFTDDHGGQLIMDVTTGNFHFQKQNLVSDNNATDSAKPAGVFSEKNKLVRIFQNYLDSKGLLDDTLANGRSDVVFNGSSPADSDSADISIWPADIDNLPISTPTFNHGLIEATATNPNNDSATFLKVNYTFWPIDKSTFSTYPLKTTEQAFNDLRSGLGVVVIEPKNPQVSISSVYLSYYESENYSPYLQPVFVFEGPDFAAFVPAVLFNSNQSLPTPTGS